MLGQACLIVSAFLMGLAAVTGWVGVEQDAAFVESDTDTGFAVVELFTSQGCSSCPPADRVLAHLADSRKDGQPIYLLSFHVDYWNDLGWKDPYSLPVCTARQKAYAKVWSSRRVYTPQMVVNGTYEFNGGNQRKARLAIEEGLSQTAKMTVELQTSVDTEGKGVIVDYFVDGASEDHLINIAVVTRRVQNEVSRGENRGSTLLHVNVVRAFKAERLDGSAGQVRLRLPSDFKWKTGSVIGYVQRRADAVLMGATTKTLR